MSVRAAAAKYDIPYPTLHKHITKGSATKLLGRFRRTFSNDHESELVCITRPVSCIWHGWSSYSAWPFTVSVRYSWISHRLDSVVHHELLADCQLRRWRVDRVCCHLRRASRQRSGTHPLSFINCWCHKHCIVLWSERSFICRRYTFVRPLWCSELCSWGSETSDLYRKTPSTFPMPVVQSVTSAWLCPVEF